VAARRRRATAQDTTSAARAVRRRGDGPPGLRKLPHDFDELASGRRDALRPRRRPNGRINDSRVAGLIAGVANHEARRLYDVRVEKARRALADGDEAELGRQLCEAVLLELWRARSITSFDAFAQDVVGIEASRARELAQTSASERGVSLERLPDVAVALYARSEVALLERCPGAAVTVKVEGEQLQLVLSLPISPPARAAEAVAAVGRSASGLARVLLDKPPRS
jgi:hypothetical protein